MSQPIVFSDAAALLLAGGSVTMAIAVRLELPGETLNLAMGQGSIVDNVGTRWTGLGAAGSIDGFDFGPKAATQPFTLTLTGLDAELARLAREDSANVRGSIASIYVLLFDQNLRPIDLPYLCQIGIMDRMSFKRAGSVYAIEVPVEPLFASKHIPGLNLLTDADQQARWPGDKIFDRTNYKHAIFWS